MKKVEPTHSTTETSISDGALVRAARRFTELAERWFPDAFIFVAFAVAISTIAAFAIGAPAQSIANAFGDGFWSLITFTMQLALLLVTGYVVAVSPPVERLMIWLASWPQTGRGAVGLIATVAMSVSLLNWAMSLIVGGLLVRACAQRDDLNLDYRAAGAAAYLGLGATWAFGVGSLSAQLQANVNSLPPSLLAITGVIPLRESVFLWPSLATLAVLFVVSLIIAIWSAPSQETSITVTDLKITSAPLRQSLPKPTRPSEWFAYSPVVSLVLVALGALWIFREFADQGALTAISNLNTYNFCFLMAGLLLHWRPARFLSAVANSMPAVSGVLIQFPFFGAIAAILTIATDANGVSVSDHIAHGFTSLPTSLYPIAVATYSTVLGTFIPSGGGRWVVAAPAVMQAAIDLKVHLGWAVQLFNVVSMPLLINPFFMLPLVAILGLKPRDIVGYTFLQFLWHVPVVLFLLWYFTGALPYSPPQIP